MKASNQVLVIAGVCNTVALANGLGYALVVSRSPGIMPPLRVVLVWALALVVLNWGVVAPVIATALRPLDRALEALRAQRPLDAAELAAARRLGLTLPVWMSRWSTYLWMGSAATFLLVKRFSTEPISELEAVHVVLSTVLVGATSGAFVFLAVETFAQQDVLPTLLEGSRPSSLVGVSPVTVGFKILVMLAVTLALPIGVLTLISTVGSAGPQVILYLGCSFFLTGLALGAFISRSVSRPVEALAQVMSRAGKGDLSVRAQVTSIDVIGRLGEGFNDMVADLQRAAFIQETFGRYVAPPVVKAALEGKVSLGGELRQATVLFSDIRNFTALSENLSPAQVVHLLNSYLDRMVEVVVSQGGTVDKFIGDAVMATFGVPLAGSDDALRGVRTAMQMIGSLAEWNRERSLEGQPTLEIGIGVHTGEVLVGNIGSVKKMEYTVIGDTVNTAARIEQLTKGMGSVALISRTTYEQVKSHVGVEVLPPVAVKGKSDPLEVFKVTAVDARPAGL